jgi:AcrR family transcriptional regulator
MRATVASPMPARRRSSASAKRASPPARVRLPAAARRQQLVDVAARLLTDHGAAGVEILQVAARAQVTRPIVYKFFRTRLDLIQGVLDDFEAELSRRFHEALLSSLGRPLPEIVDAFIQGSCDAIEAKGKGAWHLLYARSPDQAAAGRGRTVLGRLLGPWLPRIAQLTGVTPQRARLLSEIVVAAGGAALDGWLEGPLSRRDAVRVASRAVTALLREFAAG